MNFFCLESHILPFPKVLKIPLESPCIYIYLYTALHVKCSLLLSDFNGTLEVSCSVRTDRLTDMTKLIVAFSNFAKASEKYRRPYSFAWSWILIEKSSALRSLKFEILTTTLLVCGTILFNSSLPSAQQCINTRPTVQVLMPI